MSAAKIKQSRRLIVLGSTGSIGVNTLDVVDHLNKTEEMPIEVVALAAGRSVDKLITQAKRFNVKYVAIADDKAKSQIEAELPGVTVFSGDDAPRILIETVDATDVAAAIVGAAGLPATLEAARRGMRISLANKETLVAAGGLVKPLVQKNNAELIPVDSEHSAIFQCLSERAHDGDDSRSVKRIVLTASGGPFRNATREQIENATVEEALNHPTWNMGPKITIDSATMMNKALEIIEAYWLFDLLPADSSVPASEKIGVIVHPQSVIHSFVEFTDHSILAQLGPPDMRTPIQYAMTYPDRRAGCSEAMNWDTLSELTFESPDLERFPALRLAFEVIESIRSGGQTAGAIFNAANEAAVAAFLDRRIRFGQIVELVEQALSEIPPAPIKTLDDVLAADQAARNFIQEQLTGAAV